MKKFISILLSLISVICIAFALIGCGDKNNENNKESESGGGNKIENTFPVKDKEIARIETRISFGEVQIYYDPVRTFDFSTGIVTDTATMGDRQIQFLIERYNEEPQSFPDFKTAQEYEKHLRDYYNTPEQAASFTKAQAEAFEKAIVSLGVYAWNEEYDNNSYTCGSARYITIIFTDGTQKQTRFYDDYPKNYKAVEDAFKKYLGVGIYCTK